MGLFSFAKGLKQAKEGFKVQLQEEAAGELKQRLADSGMNAVRLKLKGYG